MDTRSLKRRKFLFGQRSRMYSRDILRQAEEITWKITSWAEFCLKIRERNEEPNLLHMESWVQTRALAQKDAYLPQNNQRANSRSSKEGSNPGDWRKNDNLIGTTQITTLLCSLCKGKHRIWRCDRYKTMKPSKRYEDAKRLKLCYNCLTANHDIINCSSPHKSD